MRLLTWTGKVSNLQLRVTFFPKSAPLSIKLPAHLYATSFLDKHKKKNLKPGRVLCIKSPRFVPDYGGNVADDFLQGRETLAFGHDADEIGVVRIIDDTAIVKLVAQGCACRGSESALAKFVGDSGAGWYAGN